MPCQTRVDTKGSRITLTVLNRMDIIQARATSTAMDIAMIGTQTVALTTQMNHPTIKLHLEATLLHLLQVMRTNCPNTLISMNQ